MTQRPDHRQHRPQAQTDSPYPRDRFDDVPPYEGRRGLHRAAPPSAAGPSGLVGISIAAALALVVGAFCFLLLPSLLPAGSAGTPTTAGSSVGAPAEGADSGDGSSAESTAAAGAGESGAASGSGESGGAGESGESAAAETAQPSDSAEPSETASAEPTESETALPDTGDTSAPVEVYNTTNRGGLAGRVSGNLSAAGFTVAASANWQGFTVPQSAVYYSRNVTTAQAVANQLGLPLVQDARIPGIAVVLAADYSG